MYEPETTPQLPAVILVDDHPAVRQGLALLLSTEGIEVCAEASDGAGTLAAIAEHPGCLAIVDLSLDGEDGMELVQTLAGKQVLSLVYSMHEDAAHIRGAISAGARGYVTKREVHRVLLEAIRQVAGGQHYLSPHAAAALAHDVPAPPQVSLQTILSEQELQVFRLIGRGEGTIEIADTLGVSTRTIDSYYARIQNKLGVRGMRDLRRVAVQYSTKQ